MSRTEAETTGGAVGAEREKSLDYIARRYTRALASFFHRRTADKVDVPDLVQDTFLRLSRLTDFDQVREPERYLFQTASSALRDRARRDAVRERSAHCEFDEAQHGGSEFCPERVAAGRLAVRELHDAVARLPERTRDIFVLRAFEGMRTAQIAAAKGISQRAVEKHYAKGLAKVTAAMKARGHV